MTRRRDCRHGRSCGHDLCPCVDDIDTPCADFEEPRKRTPKAPVSVRPPLFVPLMREWFAEFRVGTKDTEFRRAGGPWNERTCPPGRPAVIANGFGWPRLSAVVEEFREQDEAPEAFDKIFPGHRVAGGRVAAIKFRNIAPLPVQGQGEGRER